MCFYSLNKGEKFFCFVLNFSDFAFIYFFDEVLDIFFSDLWGC